MIVVAVPVAAAGRIVFAGPAWAAIDRGASCAAVGRSELIAPRGSEQARASVGFDRQRPGRRGEVHFRLSRPAGGGAQAMLTVGSEQFLLLTRGADAWSRDPAQDLPCVTRGVAWCRGWWPC